MMTASGSNLQTSDDQELLTTDAAAAIIDVDTATLSRMHSYGQVIGIAREEGLLLFPAWQFAYDGQPFHDVSNVLASLGGDHDLAYGFMNAAHPEIGGMTGIEHLRMSRTENLGTLASRWMARLST
jgi:hypothetical protein